MPHETRAAFLVVYGIMFLAFRLKGYGKFPMKKRFHLVDRTLTVYLYQEGYQFDVE